MEVGGGKGGVGGRKIGEGAFVPDEVIVIFNGELRISLGCTGPSGRGRFVRKLSSSLDLPVSGVVKLASVVLIGLLSMETTNEVGCCCCCCCPSSYSSSASAS